jgi:phosphoserine aminotransferase
MNVCFLPTIEDHTKGFIEKAAEAGCVGIGGHRSVGGFRASIYNAMTKEGVQRLVDVMKEWERTHG